MKITKYFKLFESRSSNLSEEEFFKLMKENCKIFLDNPKVIQRVKGNTESTYSYLDPKIHNRTKGSTSNLAKNLLLLLDNLEAWKDYPKRNNSIIATSGFSKNSIYGLNFYIIIPFDGAKFGVVPCDDLWSCRFKTNGGSLGIGALSYEMNDNSVPNTDYNEMMSDMQILYEGKRNLVDWGKSVTNKFFDFLRENNYDNIEKAFIDIIRPEKLFDHDKLEKNFRVSDYNGLVADEAEIWTDSKCLVYNLGRFKDDAFIGPDGIPNASITKQDMFNKFIEKINNYYANK